MTKYVTEEIELDQESIDKLNQIAKEHNATLDEVVNFILLNFISKTVTIGELENILNQVDTDSTKECLLKEHYIIVDDFKKPIARMIPIANTKE